MNAKQERFANEYLVDMNATQAAIRAGYSEHTAYAQGSRLLKHDEVQGVINKGKQERVAKLELTAEVVLGGLLDIALHGAVDSARVRAFELLGKHLALFSDRLEITQIPDPALVRQWVEALEADVSAST